MTDELVTIRWALRYYGDTIPNDQEPLQQGLTALDSLERELTELREAANPDICLMCGKEHEEREIPNTARYKGWKNSVTWAADDGHPYKPRRSWPDTWLPRLRALSHYDEVTGDG